MLVLGKAQQGSLLCRDDLLLTRPRHQIRATVSALRLQVQGLRRLGRPQQRDAGAFRCPVAQPRSAGLPSQPFRPEDDSSTSPSPSDGAEQPRPALQGIRTEESGCDRLVALPYHTAAIIAQVWEDSDGMAPAVPAVPSRQESPTLPIPSQLSWLVPGFLAAKLGGAEPSSSAAQNSTQPSMSSLPVSKEFSTGNGAAGSAPDKEQCTKGDGLNTACFVGTGTEEAARWFLEGDGISTADPWINWRANHRRQRGRRATADVAEGGYWSGSAGSTVQQGPSHRQSYLDSSSRTSASTDRAGRGGSSVWEGRFCSTGNVDGADAGGPAQPNHQHDGVAVPLAQAVTGVQFPSRGMEGTAVLAHSPPADGREQAAASTANHHSHAVHAAPENSHAELQPPGKASSQQAPHAPMPHYDHGCDDQAIRSFHPRGEPIAHPPNDSKEQVQHVAHDLPAVLSLMRQRVASGSKPGARRDGFQLGLVLEGGGMRGVVNGGALQALHDLGIKDAFDAVYGASAGAMNAAYFLSEQRGGVHIYHDHIATSDFISLKRLWRGGQQPSPVLNLSYLVDEVMHDVNPLDWQRVIHSPIPLKVVASSLDWLCPVVLSSFESKEDLMASLKASACIPEIAGGPIKHRGHRLVDAAVFEAIPFRSAIADGCTHVLVLCTRKLTAWDPWSISSHLEAATEAVIKRALLSPDYMAPAWQVELDNLKKDNMREDDMLLKACQSQAHLLPWCAGAHVHALMPRPEAYFSPLCTNESMLRAGLAEGRRMVFQALRPALSDLLDFEQWQESSNIMPIPRISNRHALESEVIERKKQQ